MVFSIFTELCNSKNFPKMDPKHEMKINDLWTVWRSPHCGSLQNTNYVQGGWVLQLVHNLGTL